MLMDGLENVAWNAICMRRSVANLTRVGFGFCVFLGLMAHDEKDEDDDDEELDDDTDATDDDDDTDDTDEDDEDDSEEGDDSNDNCAAAAADGDNFKEEELFVFESLFSSLSSSSP